MISLDFQILGNSVSIWISFVLIILLSFLIRKFISKRLISIILNTINKTQIEGDFNKKLNNRW